MPSAAMDDEIKATTVAARPAAALRLAAKVGEPLARFLLFALAADQRARPRRTGRRGSSSP